MKGIGTYGSDTSHGGDYSLKGGGTDSVLTNKVAIRIQRKLYAKEIMHWKKTAQKEENPNVRRRISIVHTRWGLHMVGGYTERNTTLVGIHGGGPNMKKSREKKNLI